MTIAARYAQVRHRVDEAAARGGRDSGDVTIVAVSKTFPADVVLEAHAAGVEVFGENRAQELRDKSAALGDRVVWHFVGHLQTNKVRQVVGVAALIHSVDRYGLAEMIARRARSLGIVQDVLLEVNIAREATKHGVEPESAASLATEIAGLEGIAVRGFMGMAPLGSAPGDARPYFEELAALRDRLADDIGAAELSMGMSSDFEVAIEVGATIVRIGEAIFGPRRGA